MDPTQIPTLLPSSNPSKFPSKMPSSMPTSDPSVVPSNDPTDNPSMIPPAEPSSAPSILPTTNPSSDPSTFPTTIPSSIPTEMPTEIPNIAPSLLPSNEPTNTMIHSTITTNNPTDTPTNGPINGPTNAPTVLTTKTKSTTMTTQLEDSGDTANNATDSSSLEVWIPVLVIGILVLLCLCLCVLIIFGCLYFKRNSDANNNANTNINLPQNSMLVGNPDSIKINQTDTNLNGTNANANAKTASYAHLIQLASLSGRDGNNTKLKQEFGLEGELAQNMPENVTGNSNRHLKLSAKHGIGSATDTPDNNNAELSESGDNNELYLAGDDQDQDGDANNVTYVTSGATSGGTSGGVNDKNVHKIDIGNWQNWNDIDVIEWLSNELRGNYSSKRTKEFMIQFEKIGVNGKILKQWLAKSDVLLNENDTVYTNLLKELKRRIDYNSESFIWDHVVQAIAELPVSSNTIDGGNGNSNNQTEIQIQFQD